MSALEPAVQERVTSEPDDAPWRTLEYFATTRVIVASALVLGAAALGVRGSGVAAGMHSGLLMSLAYFGASAVFAGLALYWHRHFMPQVFGQLALDLAAVHAVLPRISETAFRLRHAEHDEAKIHAAAVRQAAGGGR